VSALRELSRAFDAPRAGLLVCVLPPGLCAGRARMLVLRSALASRRDSGHRAMHFAPASVLTATSARLAAVRDAAGPGW
jgi:hypothetical protein